jgi:hypothetical protein
MVESVHPFEGGELHRFVGLQPANSTRGMASALRQAQDRAVPVWLQSRFDRFPDPGRIHIGQWLQEQVVDTIASPKLREAWSDWFDQAEGR